MSPGRTRSGHEGGEHALSSSRALLPYYPPSGILILRNGYLNSVPVPRMPSSWIDSVRQSGQLSIFPGKTATGGGWSTTFNTAITRFNTLANLLNLGVTFTASNTPPDPNGFGGASGALVSFFSGVKMLSLRRGAWPERRG